MTDAQQTFILALIAFPLIAIITLKIIRHLRIQRIIQRRLSELTQERK